MEALASHKGWLARQCWSSVGRAAVMREAVPNRAWTFDQLLGVFYVHVPIRMTVLRMDAGGLVVYAPVAPTQAARAATLVT